MGAIQSIWDSFWLPRPPTEQAIQSVIRDLHLGRQKEQEQRAVWAKIIEVSRRFLPKPLPKPKALPAAPETKPSGPEFPVKPDTEDKESAESRHDRHGPHIRPEPHEYTQRRSQLASLRLVQKISTPSKTLPPPLFSKKWQASFRLFSAGGKLQMPDSDVILEVPKDAVDEDSRNQVYMAVSIDLDDVASVLGIQADEQICSVPVDLWISVGFRFRKHIHIVSPHFLPPDFDRRLVRVYCVRRGSDGEVLVTRVRQQEPWNVQTGSVTSLTHPSSGGNTQHLDTKSKPRHSPAWDSHLAGSDPPKITSTSFEEKEDTNVPWDGTAFFQISSGHVIVSTDHLSAYVCTNQHSGPLVLNALACGRLTHRVGDQQTADVSVHVWDGRLYIKDFRQEYGLINEGEFLDRTHLDVMPNCPDSRLAMSAIIATSSSTHWQHSQGPNGQPLIPPLRESDLSRLLTSCNHDGCECSSRNTGPISTSWMLETRPGGNPKTGLQCAIFVSQVARDATPQWSRRKGLESSTVLRVKLPKQGFLTESYTQTDRSFPLPASPPLPPDVSESFGSQSLPGSLLTWKGAGSTQRRAQARREGDDSALSAADEYYQQASVEVGGNCPPNGAGEPDGRPFTSGGSRLNQRRYHARPKYSPGLQNDRQNGARSSHRQPARAQNMDLTSRNWSQTDDTELKKWRGEDFTAHERPGPAVNGTSPLSGPQNDVSPGFGALNLNDSPFPPAQAGARSVNYYVKVNGSATFNSRAKKTRCDSGRQDVATPELMDDETLEEYGGDDSRVSVESQYETRGQPEENPFWYGANVQPAVAENGTERQA